MHDIRETPAEGGGRRPASPHGSMAAVVVGMACFWQLFRYTNLKSMLPLDAGAFAAGHLEAASPVTAFYAVMLALSLVALASGRLLDAWSRPRAALVVCASSSLLSSALILLKGAGFSPSGAYMLLGGIALLAVALSFVVLASAWARACASLAGPDPKRLVFVLCASSLVSFVVSLGFSIGEPSFELLVAIAPLCSAACLALSVGGAPRAEPAGSAFDELPRHLLPVLIALLLIIVCVKGLGDVLYSTGADSALYLKHFITVSELVAIMSVCLFASGMSRFALLGWVVLVGGVVSGLGLLFFFSNSSSAFQFGLGTIAAAKTCLELFVFALVACLDGKRAPRSIVVLLLVPEGVSYMLGCGLLPLAAAASGSSAFEWFAVLSLGAGIAIAVSAFLVMSSLALKGLGDDGRGREGAEEGASAADANDEALFDGIAEEFGLTKRERETAYLFFKGYSTKRIAELHFVSLNTTQSHLRSTYRKMGIHSRQDLIDLVARTSGD